MAAPPNDHLTRLIARAERRYDISQERIRRSMTVLALTAADLDAAMERLGEGREDHLERETRTGGGGEVKHPPGITRTALSGAIRPS
jgi:hypothetical protein